VPAEAPPRPEEVRALIASLVPAHTPDRAGWATDVYAAFAALDVPPTPEHVCAVVAVIEQESGFRVDPPVPELGSIARREIDARARRAGIPSLAVRAALHLESPDGQSYGERIDAVRTERELSDVYEDFIGMVPLGNLLFAGWNPVRTGGPMQVSVRFAEEQAAAKPYPYPLEGSIRHEVFTRRGGVYFGIAHLLDYPASYDSLLYRFADYNAGRWASRNAALQNAIAVLTGIPLALDGDLVRHDGDSEPSSTEIAARVLAARLDMSRGEIRRDLAHGNRSDLDQTDLWERTFALAEAAEGHPLPRAVVPQIMLESPKIQRKLTTQWFADRVDGRYQRCLAQAGLARTAGQR
jgi:hypothetical protein